MTQASDNDDAFSTLAWSDAYVSTLSASFYSSTPPDPLPNPRLVVWNNSGAVKLLGSQCARADDASVIRLCNATHLPPMCRPVSQVYAGWQFGVWKQQLGDGRAHMLGQVCGPDDCLRDLVIKGSGKTPYSRMDDGRAVLRSVVREYIASEAMHALGVPTTRALCVLGSSLHVDRDGKKEEAAIMLRVTPTSIRFGTFEYFHHRNEPQHVIALADYLIKHHFTDISAGDYAALFRRIVHANADLVAKWQAIGFVHGVLNTDNVSVLGVTLDYGPFGFLDVYDPSHVWNQRDAIDKRRYAYNKQPSIMQWNVHKLADALVALIPDSAARSQIAAEFTPRYRQRVLAEMQRKLGLGSGDASDQVLVDGITHALQMCKVDWTLFWRRLSDTAPCDLATDAWMTSAFAAFLPLWNSWCDEYCQRVRDIPEHERRQLMQKCNPVYVPRNHKLAEMVEQVRQHDNALLLRMLDVYARDPFRVQADAQDLAEGPSDGATCSLTCSS